MNNFLWKSRKIILVFDFILSDFEIQLFLAVFSWSYFWMSCYTNKAQNAHDKGRTTPTRRNPCEEIFSAGYPIEKQT